MNILNEETIKILKDIRNYIKDHYPDSCIAHNQEKEGEELLEECSDFFKYEILGFCGCGMNSLCVESVVNYLSIVKVQCELNFKTEKLYQEKFGINDVYSNGLILYMAYDLDDRELTEHGSNIIGDWVYLTKRIEEYQNNPIGMCKDAPSQPFKTKVKNIVHTKSGKTLYQVNRCHFSDKDIGVSVFKNYDDARDNLKK